MRYDIAVPAGLDDLPQLKQFAADCAQVAPLEETANALAGCVTRLEKLRSDLQLAQDGDLQTIHERVEKMRKLRRLMIARDMRDEATTVGVEIDLLSEALEQDDGPAEFLAESVRQTETEAVLYVENLAGRLNPEDAEGFVDEDAGEGMDVMDVIAAEGDDAYDLYGALTGRPA